MNLKFDCVEGRSTIRCDDSAIIDRIRHEFSTENKAKQFAKHKKFIASRLYAITPAGAYEPGLTKEIARIVEAKQIVSACEYTSDAVKVFQPFSAAKLFDKLSLDMRDYQTQAVERAIESGRGVCLLATGAGKTLVMASLAASFYNNPDFKCLVLVPDPGLALQTFNDFLEYNLPCPCSLWTGKHKVDLSANIIIANHDIVLSRFEENEWIQDVDILIADEVHSIKKSNQINKIIAKISTLHKFGFTGTLPTDLIDRWNVIGKFGDVLITKTSHELREEKHLVSVEARVVDLYYKTKPKTKDIRNKNGEKATTARYHSELEFLYENDFRNNLIQQLCSSQDKNVLVLVNHLDHGRLLHKKLQQGLTSKNVFFIEGDVELDDREIVKQKMEQTDNMVVVAMSSIFSTGINIKNLHMIIFAAGGKSFIRVVQSIGRGLRKHISKDKLVLIDICDHLKYALDHSQHRIRIYNDEKIPFTRVSFTEK